jgi:peptidoglycan hydrolase-like protein with peptidoglycan-binding domain
MKAWRYGIAIGVLAGLGACSNLDSRGSAPPPVATIQPTVVAPDMVKQVQMKLHDGGYYKQGPVDGVWGPGTEVAVRAFQKDHNLGSTGQLDVPTLQALNVTSGPAVANNTAPTQPQSAQPQSTQPVSGDPNTAPAGGGSASSTH